MPQAEVPAGRSRVAVVTGGMSGIGAATVERLRADGLEVMTMDMAPGADLRADVSRSAEVTKVT